MVGNDQPDAREGQAGRSGVAERFVVPLKPGNAGGGNARRRFNIIVSSFAACVTSSGEQS